MSKGEKNIRGMEFPDGDFLWALFAFVDGKFAGRRGKVLVWAKNDLQIPKCQNMEKLDSCEFYSSEQKDEILPLMKNRLSQIDNRGQILLSAVKISTSKIRGKMSTFVPKRDVEIWQNFVIQ